jgi:hypothetical protein
MTSLHKMTLFISFFCVCRECLILLNPVLTIMLDIVHSLLHICVLSVAFSLDSFENLSALPLSVASQYQTSCPEPQTVTFCTLWQILRLPHSPLLEIMIASRRVLAKGASNTYINILVTDLICFCTLKWVINIRSVFKKNFAFPDAVMLQCVRSTIYCIFIGRISL